MPRPHITEWASVFQAYRTGKISALLVIYLAVLIFFGGLAMWRSHWREITASLALAVTLGLGLKHLRHLPFFLIVTGAYLPVCLNGDVVFIQDLAWIRKLRANFRIKVGALILLSLFTVLNIYSSISNHPLSLRLLDTANPLGLHAKVNYPVTAVNLFKKLHLSGKILTKFVWGEYLIWELYPQCRVTLDGRYETVYPREVLEDYAKFYYARPQWRQFLQDYPPDMILLDKRMAVAGLIGKDPHWREVYADAGCVLFTAKNMAGKASPEVLLQKGDQPHASGR
jgi:hypothetical protein